MPLADEVTVPRQKALQNCFISIINLGKILCKNKTALVWYVLIIRLLLHLDFFFYACVFECLINGLSVQPYASYLLRCHIFLSTFYEYLQHASRQGLKRHILILAWGSMSCFLCKSRIVALQGAELVIQLLSRRWIFLTLLVSVLSSSVWSWSSSCCWLLTMAVEPKGERATKREREREDVIIIVRY